MLFVGLVGQGNSISKMPVWPTLDIYYLLLLCSRTPATAKEASEESLVCYLMDFYIRIGQLPCLLHTLAITARLHGSLPLKGRKWKREVAFNC
jgi:hypothetical protein